MKDASELRSLLAGHTGTTQWFRHPFSRCTYTDGVNAFAENAGGGAYWLLDILLTEPVLVRGQREFDILFITLAAREGKATITAVRDSGKPPIFERVIDYTDCPDGDWPFYFAADVLYLPSEH